MDHNGTFWGTRLHGTIMKPKLRLKNCVKNRKKEEKSDTAAYCLTPICAGKKQRAAAVVNMQNNSTQQLSV